EDAKQTLEQKNFQEDEQETRCGFGAFHPDWLQKLASKKCYIIVYGLTGMVDLICKTYFSSTISTIEKRFKIQSKMSGILASSFQVGVLSSVLILAYLGSSGNKSRWLSSGILVVSLGCFMRLIPHVIYGPGKDALDFTEEFGDIDWHANNNSSLTKATWQCIRMLGPTVGYLSGSYALSLYVDPLLHPTITNSDPQWIGAWWLGWVPFAIINIILAILFAMFPKKLPRTAERMRAIGVTIEKSKKSFSDFKQVILRLIKNKILLFNSFSFVCFLFGLTGFWVFQPKYIEYQFRQTASMSSFVTGIIGLVCSALGVLTSGIIITKFKPSARYLAGWNVFAEALEVIGNFSFIFITCSVDNLEGSMKPDQSWNMTTNCNNNCGCGPNLAYSPVCSSDGTKTFYSPCHAGCQVMNTINGTRTYDNCSCIDPGGWVVKGPCHVDCSTPFAIFLIIQCLIKFFSAAGRAGNAIIQFRCVAHEDKSVSIAFTECLLSALALIPGPILFGMLLGFLLGGTLLDVGVWYYAKDLDIYDKPEDLYKNDIDIYPS
ncbi:hypothetical protein C0J52_12003, partial [Blattella germanica]